MSEEAIRWTPEQFAMVQKIARRHDVRCRLRVAMVTGDDADGTRVCSCDGKVNAYGEPKTTPRERTLADVLRQGKGGGPTP